LTISALQRRVVGAEVTGSLKRIADASVRGGSAEAYYPQTATCSEPWIKVPPRQD